MATYIRTTWWRQPRRKWVPSKPVSHTYTYSGTGGAQTGGVANQYSLTKVPLATGGAQTGGSATVSKTKTYVPSGGAQTGGAATYSLTKVPLATGGAQTGGSASSSKTKTYVATGGASTGGVANQYSLTKVPLASGGAQTGGSATSSKSKTYVGSGGCSTGGVANQYSLTKVPLATGGAQTGGTATYQFIPNGTYTYVGSGGAQTGGAATYSLTKVPIASGGAHTGGSATYALNPTSPPTPVPGVSVTRGGWRPPGRRPQLIPPAPRRLFMYRASGGLVARPAGVYRFGSAVVLQALAKALERETASKMLEEVLSDDQFWHQQKLVMLAAVEPLFLEAFVAGAEAAATEVGKRKQAKALTSLAGAQLTAGVELILAGARADVRMKVLADETFWSEQLGIVARSVRSVGYRAEPLIDVEAINSAAQEAIAAYSNTWWETKILPTQRANLKAAIATARELGLGPRKVAELVASDFGPDRAMLIAVTELTNLIGAGAQAQYKAEGFEQWDWDTSNDSRVCVICQARAADGPYGIHEGFSSAHPGCRCWPVPAGVAAVAVA